MKTPIFHMIKNFIPIALLLMVASCSQQGKQGYASGPVPVNLQTVSSREVFFYDTYPATVVALNKVNLHSEVSGYVTGIFFSDGSHVEKGQKLYEIDRSKYQAAYEQAKASVDIANANLGKAQRDADRYTRLQEQDAVAKQIVENALTDLQNAQNQLAAANAGLLKAKTDLDYAVITAPFSGSIGFSQVKLGTFINAGQTVMNILSSNNPMGADIQIDEKNLERFEALKARSKQESDSTFRLVLPGRTMYPEPGRISVIDRGIDPQTGTIKVRLIFPNEQGTLKDGMTSRVKVLNSSSGKQVIIPFKSVVEQMSEYFVFVADSGKVHQRKITPGPNLDGEIIVQDGLQPGEQIVTEGVQKLREGMPIATSQHEGGAPSGAGK